MTLASSAVLFAKDGGSALGGQRMYCMDRIFCQCKQMEDLSDRCWPVQTKLMQDASLTLMRLLSC